MIGHRGDVEVCSRVGARSVGRWWHEGGHDAARKEDQARKVEPNQHEEGKERPRKNGKEERMQEVKFDWYKQAVRHSTQLLERFEG